MKNENFSLIDIFKFIFSIFIIGIHTEVFINSSTIINWYLVHGLLRLAVPFFFIISGFFYFKKCSNNKDIKKYTKSYIKKLFIPFLFWLSIGLIISEFKNTWTNNFLWTILLLIRKVLFYPWGALWYILALMISIIILSQFYKKNMYIEPVLLGFFLYMFALVTNSYYFILNNNSFLKRVADLYMNIFISSRNGIFVGLFLTSLGGYLYFLYSSGKLFNKKKCLLFLIISYCLFLLEITIVKNNNYTDDHSLFIFLPMVIFFFLSILIQVKNNSSFLRLRKYSIIMYLSHRPILSVVSIVFNCTTGFKCFSIVFLISLLFSIIIEKCSNKYVRLLTMT